MTKATGIILGVVGVVVLGLGIPVVWFVVTNLKAGYDDAGRAASSAASSTPLSSATALPRPAPESRVAPSVADLSAIDFGTNVTDVHEHGAHYVAALPPLHGAARNGVREGMVGQGAFEVRGGIEQLTGASTTRLPSASHAGGLCTLEVSVTHGTVRAYLSGLRGSVVDGYVFVEVSPGHPGRVTGYLEDWSGSSTPEQTFALEAVAGADTAHGGDGARVEGVSYRVYRR